jgi:hypothetical protein
VEAARNQSKPLSAATIAYLDKRRIMFADPVGPMDPQMIHLTYGDDIASVMNVAWSTRNETCTFATWRNATLSQAMPSTLRV